jgi:hypothetical protein
MHQLLQTTRRLTATPKLTILYRCTKQHKTLPLLLLLLLLLLFKPQLLHQWLPGVC